MIDKNSVEIQSVPPMPAAISEGTSETQAASKSAAYPATGQAEPSWLTQTLLRVPVKLEIVLGSVHLPLSQVVELKAGSTIHLDEKVGSPATILINGKEMAKGTLFVLEGEDARLGISIIETLA